MMIFWKFCILSAPLGSFKYCFKEPEKCHGCVRYLFFVFIFYFINTRMLSVSIHEIAHAFLYISHSLFNLKPCGI